MKNMLMSRSKDIVSLKKMNGTTREDIKAIVQPEMIVIPDGTLLIEEGDLLIRTLSNGGIEQYEVLDRGFHEKGYTIEAHYQCKVRKTTAKVFEPVAPQVTNYFNGPNARYNHHSNDYSTNIVAESASIFDDIKKVIEQNIEDKEQKTIIIEMVNEMESTVGTPSFKEKYTKFIQGLGEHITVLSPLIPQLTGLL